jgi:PhnB protein
MSNKVQPIPEGFHSVTPYLIVKGAAQAIEFYKRAFDAQERYRLPGPDGKSVGHAEIVIGNSIVMLADEFPEYGKNSPQTIKGTPVVLTIYVPDVDKTFQKAVDAGAKVMRPLENKFYGDRVGCVVDPFGHEWTLMTHVEDVSPEEMKKRLAGFYATMGNEKESA